MVFDIAKALLVGILAAVPVGPILFMVIQRTLCFGRKSGLMVGLGSALAETLFASLALFTLGLAQTFIDNNTVWILLIGGVFIGVIGFGMIKREVKLKTDLNESSQAPVKYVIQSFLSVISNPAALAVMMVLLKSFKIDTDSCSTSPIIIIIAVTLGEFAYWFILTALLAKYIKVKEKTLNIISKIVGVAVCVFAIVLIVKGLNIVFNYGC